jgi:uncharacterized membrane protein YbhN (UPF0104 family)
MKWSARNLTFAATVLLYAAAVAAAWAWLDERTVELARSLPLSLVAAMLGLSLLNYAARAWRWLALCAQQRLAVPARSNLLYYVAGFALASTPGKAGEAVRLWFLKSGHGVPYARSLALMVADRLLDTWAVLLLCLLSMWRFAHYAWQGAGLLLLTAAVTLPVLFPRAVERLILSVYGVAPRFGRWMVYARRTARALAALDWRTYARTLLPTVGGWMAECAALYLLLQHFGAGIGPLEATFIFAFSLVVGAISMLPGGLGSTEATLVVLLTAMGVGLGTALAVTAIIRATTFWFAVALGLAAMPLATGISLRAARLRPARQADSVQCHAGR